MLTQLLMECAERRSAERRGFHFRSYRAGQTETRTLSFAELARKAMGIARQLAAVTRPGERVLLTCDTGLPHHLAFFASLLAGTIPVPLPEPLVPAQLARCRAAAADSGARLALVGGAGSARIAAALHALQLETFEVECDVQGDEFLRARAPAYADIAYLQYTSGSTGTPKGVIVADGNVAANLALIRDRLHICEDDRLVSWLPPYHDMGLIAGVLLPVFCGMDTAIMRTSDFSVQPRRWLQAITEFAATIGVASNFAFDLCTSRIDRASRAGLDLGSLRVLISGAEPVRARTIHAFVDAFYAHGMREAQIVAGYGLAEATLLVSMRDPTCDPPRTLAVDRAALALGRVQASDASDAALLVSCGQPGPAVRVRIVDPHTLAPLPDDRVGEICTQSASVCRGFWGARAGAHLASIAEADATHSAWLRTGDLGFVHERELYVTGRLKHVIIAHGTNLHAEDLEAVVESAHPCLRPGRCAVFEDDGEQRARVIVAAELADATDGRDLAVCESIRDALRRSHGLIPDAVVLVARGQLPRTTSGKLARTACRDAYARGEWRVRHTWSRGA